MNEEYTSVLHILLIPATFPFPFYSCNFYVSLKFFPSESFKSKRMKILVIPEILLPGMFFNRILGRITKTM